jgi:MFS transporter, OFA family, oxalate/formate antiporter
MRRVSGVAEPRWWRRPGTRAIAGAVLLDLAISPLFAWDVFTDDLGDELGLGASALAGVFSLALAAYTVAVLLGGRAADVHPPRRLAVAVALGCVAGLLGCAVAPSGTVLVLGFATFAASTGTGYVVAIRVAGTIARRRGLAVGLVVSAYAGGTVVVAPLAAALLDHVGRGWTFTLLAAGIGALVLAAAALVPATKPPPSPATARTGPRTARPTRPSYGRTVPALWAVFALGSAPGLAAFGNAGDLAGPQVVGLAIPLLSVGNFAGRLVAGPASDRIGRPLSLHLDAAVLVLTCGLLAADGGAGAVATALFVLGMQYGALSVLVPAATADAVAPERFGTSFGRVFTGLGCAGLAAPVAAAVCADLVGWQATYLGFAGLAFLAWVTLACSTPGRLRGDPVDSVRKASDA